MIAILNYNHLPLLIKIEEMFYLNRSRKKNSTNIIDSIKLSVKTDDEYISKIPPNTIDKGIHRKNTGMMPIIMLDILIPVLFVGWLFNKDIVPFLKIQ